MATAPATTKPTAKAKTAKPASTTTTAAEPGTATGSATAASTLTCPECGKTFTRAAALGAHRKITHGVAGSSANAASQRKRTAARKRATPARSPRARRNSVAAKNGGATGVDRDALLRALFP